MNKLSLIFTVLRAYKQARGKETTTLRGVICGTLAAASIAGLWWMGADLSADQISLVMGAVYVVDTILKIVLPDRFGGTHDDETVPALPAIESPGWSDAGYDGVDASPVRANDGLRQSVPTDRGPGAVGANQPDGWNG